MTLFQPLSLDRKHLGIILSSVRPKKGAEMGRMVVSENGTAIFTYDPARPVEAD